MRHRVLPPITTNKHFVPHPQSTITSGTILNKTVVSGVVAPAVANAFDVMQGSVVKAVYVEMWLFSIGVNIETSFNLTVEKVPASAVQMTFGQSLALGSYLNKKNILYTTQGLVGSRGSGSPVPVIRAWVKIPKGKQRFGLGDKLLININSVGQSLQICGMIIFKEYQ